MQPPPKFKTALIDKRFSQAFPKELRQPRAEIIEVKVEAGRGRIRSTRVPTTPKPKPTLKEIIITEPGGLTESLGLSKRGDITIRGLQRKSPHKIPSVQTIIREDLRTTFFEKPKFSSTESGKLVRTGTERITTKVFNDPLPPSKTKFLTEFKPPPPKFKPELLPIDRSGLFIDPTGVTTIAKQGSQIFQDIFEGSKLRTRRKLEIETELFRATKRGTGIRRISFVGIAPVEDTFTETGQELIRTPELDSAASLELVNITKQRRKLILEPFEDVENIRIPRIADIDKSVQSQESDTATSQIIIPAIATEEVLEEEGDTPQEQEIPIPAPELEEPPTVGQPFFKREKRKGKLKPSFQPQAKSKGKWVNVSKKPQPMNKALNTMAHIIDNSASATGRILKRGHTMEQDDDRFRKRQKFRKKKNTYIELIKNRIDSPGEIQGITVKGLLALEKKRRRFLK